MAVSVWGTCLKACLYLAHPRGVMEDTAIPSKPRGYQFAWDVPHHVIVRQGKRGGASPKAPLHEGGAAAILGGHHRRSVGEERGWGGEHTPRLERAKEAMQQADRPVELIMPVEPIESSRAHWVEPVKLSTPVEPVESSMPIKPTMPLSPSTHQVRWPIKPRNGGGGGPNDPNLTTLPKPNKPFVLSQPLPRCPELVVTLSPLCPSSHPEPVGQSRAHQAFGPLSHHVSLLEDFEIYLRVFNC